MRVIDSPTPVAAYSIPPVAPEPVREAWQELNRIGAEYDDAKDQLKAAKQKAVDAEAEDVRAIATAAAAGEVLKDETAHQRKARAEVERLSTLRLVDQDGSPAGYLPYAPRQARGDASDLDYSSRVHSSDGVSAGCAGGRVGGASGRGPSRGHRPTGRQLS